jgi:hypothetical protein
MKATTLEVEEPVESARANTSAQQVAEEDGLTFARTPGPGYSEGGDVYEPKPRPRARGAAPATSRPDDAPTPRFRFHSPSPG